MFQQLTRRFGAFAVICTKRPIHAFESKHGGGLLMTWPHLFSVEASRKAAGRARGETGTGKQAEHRESGFGRGRLEAEGAWERFEMGSRGEGPLL